MLIVAQQRYKYNMHSNRETGWLAKGSTSFWISRKRGKCTCIIDWLIGQCFKPYRQYFSHKTAEHVYYNYIQLGL